MVASTRLGCFDASFVLDVLFSARRHQCLGESQAHVGSMCPRACGLDRRRRQVGHNLGGSPLPSTAVMLEVGYFGRLKAASVKHVARCKWEHSKAEGLHATDFLALYPVIACDAPRIHGFSLT